MRLGPDLLQLSSSERLQSRRCLASPKNHLPHVDGPKALRPDAPQPKPAQTRLVGATTQPNLNPIKLIKIPLKTDRTSFGASYSRSNSVISVTDNPLITGSSLSTVDCIVSRFFCCRLSIFSSTVARAINL